MREATGSAVELPSAEFEELESARKRGMLTLSAFVKGNLDREMLRSD